MKIQCTGLQLKKNLLKIKGLKYMIRLFYCITQFFLPSSSTFSIISKIAVTIVKERWSFLKLENGKNILLGKKGPPL